MERDYGNRSAATENHEIDAEVASGDKTLTNAGVPHSIPRDKARELVSRVLAERAEVFRKLAE